MLSTEQVHMRLSELLDPDEMGREKRAMAEMKELERGTGGSI